MEIVSCGQCNQDGENTVNKRIDEIEKQSYTEVMHERGGTYMAFDKQKFAELIIRDCATKANATALDLRIRPELDARKYVGDCILKCFGVEA